MRLADEEGKEFEKSSYHTLIMSAIGMHLESAIIERVETLVRHPVFACSAQAIGLVLEDLEAMMEGGRLPQATYRRLREMILRSPHLAGDN
jgi:hypothetical protein